MYHTALSESQLKLPERDAKKKPCDMKQAKAVAELIAERMPQLRWGVIIENEA